MQAYTGGRGGRNHAAYTGGRGGRNHASIHRRQRRQEPCKHTQEAEEALSYAP